MNWSDREHPVVVMGVGGAGGHMLERIAQWYAATHARFVAVNTDREALKNLGYSHVLIGTSGQAATRLEQGRAAAIHSAADIARTLHGTGELILLCGLGGGTGSGATPEIASIAMRIGINVRVVATMPWQWEGMQRSAQAGAGLKAIEALGCTVKVVFFEEFSAYLSPDTSLDECSVLITRHLIQLVGAN